MLIPTKIKVNKKDFLCCLPAVSIICMDVISHTLGIIGISGFLRTVIMLGVCYFSLALLFVISPQKIPVDAFLICGVLLLMFFFCNVTHPEYGDRINKEFFTNVLSPYRGFVFYIAIRILGTTKQTKKALSVSAYILFAFYFIQSISAIRDGYWLVMIDGKLTQAQYNMSFGYGILFPAIVFWNMALDEHKIPYWILAIVSATEIVMLGSRAAMLSIIAYIFLRILFISFSQLKGQSKLIIPFIFIIIVSITLFLYKPLLTIMASLFESIGFSSRSIELLLEGTISDDAQRSIIYDKCWELIQSGGAFGHGFLADRYYFLSYTHNVFLELLVQFGYVGGSFIIALLVYISFKMFSKNVELVWKKQFLMVFCMCFFRLLVSHSLWINGQFWMLMAMYVNYVVEQRQEIRFKHLRKISNSINQAKKDMMGECK